jgi:hypothetical protein
VNYCSILYQTQVPTWFKKGIPQSSLCFHQKQIHVAVLPKNPQVFSPKADTQGLFDQTRVPMGFLKWTPMAFFFQSGFSQHIEPNASACMA